jgi:hypothetical protein
MSLVSNGSTLTTASGKEAQATFDTYAERPFASNANGQQTNVVVLIHDAFQPLSYWDGFMPRGGEYVGAAMDTHIYQMFTNQVRIPPTTAYI